MASQNNIILGSILPIFFLGSAASLQLITSTVYLEHNPDWQLIGLSFLLTSGIYLLNRVLDKEDQINNLPRWQFFNGTAVRSYFWITLSFLALTIPVLVPVMFKKTNVALIFSIFSLSGLLYSVRLIPVIMNRKIRWACFKDIPVTKSIVVCIIWGSGALLLAVANGNVSFFRTDIIIIFTVFTISSINSTVTSDVRDIEGDRIRKIYTIPVLIGPKATCRLLLSINLLAILLSFILVIKGTISMRIGLFSSFIILWAGLSTLPQFVKPGMLPKTASEILIDSESIISALALGVLAMSRN